MSEENLNTSDESKQELYVNYLKNSYQLSIETRNFEINNFINRNNFFMLVQGVLLAAVVGNQAGKPIVEFCICLLGTILSWYQIHTGAGAKYWQTYWEKKADLTESKLHQFLNEKQIETLSLFKFNDSASHRLIDDELSKGSWIDKYIIRRKPSVTKIAIKASILLLIIWTLLLIHSLNIDVIFSTFKDNPQKILLNLISGHYFSK